MQKIAKASITWHGWQRIRYIVTGEALAAHLAMSLVRMSAWFELTPLPDDEWQFVIKPDAESRFLEAVAAFGEEED